MGNELTSHGEPSKPEAKPTWTEQERWVWNQVCVGEIADFNKADGYGAKLDPKLKEGWPENRILRPGFLQTILLREPYRNALTHNGVRIEGAWFTELLSLSDAILAHPLWLISCRFEADVDVSRLRSPYLILLNGSNFIGKLDMNSLQVEGSLLMRDGAEFAEVDLGSAKTGDQLNASTSKFKGKLNMNSLQVEGSLLMRDGAEFAEVDFRGAKIVGQLNASTSKFKGKLNMNSLQVEGSLLMRDGAEFTEVDLGSASIRGQIDMTGSKFTGKVDMNSLQVDGSLFMRTGAEFVEVVLQSARVAGQLDMRVSKFAGKVDMNNLHVEGSLIMREGAEFAEVDLIAAGIVGSLDMSGSKFTGKLNMNSLEVKGSLFMRRGARFSDVELISAKVGRQLNMIGSNFSGSLVMDSLQVEGSLLMRDATVASSQSASLVFSKVGINLDLLGSVLPSLDLTGTMIRAELVVGQQPGGTRLTLRNTEVGALQDLPDAWPDELELEGFTYGRLGGYQTDGTTDMATRDISWLKEWLARQKKFSPLPYEQLSSVLLKSGYKDKANEILYAGRERERKEGTWPNWLWLTFMKIFIGYGYRIRFSVYWVLAFIELGAIVLIVSGQGQANGIHDGIAYSFDMLLPIVKLRELHYKIDLAGWARYYFYFHKLMGYVLGSFIVAGLSGLTKK